MDLQSLVLENIEVYVSGFIVLGGALFYYLYRLKQAEKKLEDKVEQIEEKIEQKIEEVKAPVEVPKISWTQRLSIGLEKSRSEVWGKIGQLFSGATPHLDEIEEVLYTADIPTGMVQQLLEKLEKDGKGKEANDIQKLVYGFMKEKMEPVQHNIHKDVFNFHANEKKTRVFMIVGVNGAGKTTTIGKLATKLKSQGAKVIVGACDTFRAAAVDQLQVWCDRAGVDMVRAKDGADPSGVAYDTVAKAFSEGYDYCLIDTAGRLHTNQNLMDELAKTKRVMAKINPEAPQEVLLVLDAITGQNALKQAQEFHKALQLTGIIFTKCDGSAKAGSAVGIVDQLRVPITYIGVGESVDDLHLFDLDLYLKTLVGLESP
ncbi:signal recognition particle-docking protein FtsY [Peredibacter sp. HCB2-198]|uniref:signal recognition particle-docking protein FtsY n=1 Tax=Peredibacter sp. HCB2-198 TaxID=3383025 RepID=UPI0038B5B653